MILCAAEEAHVGIGQPLGYRQPLAIWPHEGTCSMRQVRPAAAPAVCCYPPSLSLPAKTTPLLFSRIDILSMQVGCRLMCQHMAACAHRRECARRPASRQSALAARPRCRAAAGKASPGKTLESCAPSPSAYALRNASEPAQQQAELGQDGLSEAAPLLLQPAH